MGRLTKGESRSSRPPRWAEWLLSNFSPPGLEDELQGDLLEMYAYWVKTVGWRRARWRYALAVLRIIHLFSWLRTDKNYTYPKPESLWRTSRTTFFLSPVMLRNYLTLAFRNLLKNKISAGINMTGLALGIATFLFILEYISFERSINQFHRNLPTLHRILIQDRSNFSSELIPPGLAPLLKQQFGEIASYCRTSGGIIHGIVSTGDPRNGKSFREGDQAMTMVDERFFDLFSFPILAGQSSRLISRLRWPFRNPMPKSILAISPLWDSC